MSGKQITILAVIASIVAIFAGILWFNNNQMMYKINMESSDVNSQTSDVTSMNQHDYAKNLIEPKEGQPIKKFSLTAKESTLNISKDLNIPVWTYNGTVPGTEIRVKQGDFVQVELTNTLKEPITIHWHGYPVLSGMDGIPGVTQDSIRPGESFTYEFSADIAGTYWYHSHQEGSKQVDKGLYGALIVEPKEEAKPDKDYTLILDEWMKGPVDEMSSMTGMNNGSMSDMDEMSATDPVKAEEEMMSNQYNIYTVNGKSGELISPLNVKKGDVVRLRFINAGYRSHGIHIPGQNIKIVSTDGQAITGAQNIKDQVILIGPGERYDVEFTVSSNNNFIIDAHDENKFNDQIKIPVNVLDGSGKEDQEKNNSSLPLFDLSKYGESEMGEFTLNQKYDVDYNVELNTAVDGNSLKYTINNQVFNELPPLTLKTGQLVKMTFENKSIVDHPMHLHGHFFQVLSKNGQPFKSSILKDTILVKPGEKYIVAFKADNPGIWVQHCHELHHAAAGMMQEIIYSDYNPNYTADFNSSFNKPE